MKSAGLSIRIPPASPEPGGRGSRPWAGLSRLLAVALSGLCLSAAAAAQAPPGYPDKPIRLIVPFATGGASDTVARHLAPKLAAVLGQSVIIDNRGGAGGSIGAGMAAKAAPDGYTLLLTFGPPHETAQFFLKNSGYDPVNDFEPIATVAIASQAITVRTDSPIKSLDDLLALGKKDNGFTYGTSGIGTAQHLAGLLLNLHAKINSTHVAYKGGGPALNDVLGGQVDIGILTLSNLVPHVEAGKLKILGVTEAQRAQQAPDIPTLAEVGLPGFAVPSTWAGVFGPKGLAPDKVAYLGKALEQAVNDPDTRSKLEGVGYEISYRNAETFRKLLVDNTELYRRIVTESGIVAE